MEMGTERSQGDTLAPAEGKLWRGLYAGRKPASLALLTVLAVVFFAGVSGLSRIYHAQQEALGNRWFTRGIADLKNQRFERAVSEFRSALVYSRDNYSYQMNLTAALIGLKRTDEADAYLVNLWEREPENGRVNLELARIAAQSRQTEPALRYYHNAIYAVWPGDQEAERREARLELIEFLLSNDSKLQAQSELIALAASLDGDPSQHVRVAGLFLRAQDYEHALSEYRLGLKPDHHNPEALAGAGWAAFELGHYSQAQRYLQAVVSIEPGDAKSAARLKTAELVLRLDPFQRQLSLAERRRMTIEAYATAGQRLKECPAVGSSRGMTPSASGPQSLIEKWEQMKGRISEPGLRRNPDLVENAMDMVFDIERQTNIVCGPPTGTDLALLLIAKLHERN